MEEVLVRFTHLGEEIFASLGMKSLLTCRKVCTPWNSFIKNQKTLWLFVISKHDENSRKNDFDFSIVKKRKIEYDASNANFEESFQRWRKLFQKINTEDVKRFAKRILLEEENWKIKNFILYKKDFSSDRTVLHYACIYGNLKITEIILKNLTELNIDLNARDNNIFTPFDYACKSGLNAIYSILSLTAFEIVNVKVVIQRLQK